MTDRAWAEYAQKRRVFILGAGFSAEAGIPMTATLLDAAMKTFADECPGIYERICNYTRDVQWDCDGDIDFSKVTFSDLCKVVYPILFSTH